MAIIDVVEWSPTSNDVYAYKYPHTNLSTGTQLIVRESQEAVFFSKGQILGKFGPGKHVLSTEYLPLLRNLFGIPFGGKNPFFAEVWFVNKTMPLNIDWRTTTMRYLDPEYGQSIPLFARGRYGLKVKDAERFLVRLVGALTQFTARELTDHFLGALIAKTNSSIMGFMNANRVGINQISSYLDDLSSFIKQPMGEFWEDYGMELVGFYITDVNIDTSTEEGRNVAEAISQRSAQGIAGYTWQQQQSFNVANNAVDNGGNAGILGVAMLTGAFSGNGGMGQSMMQTPPKDQYQVGNQFSGNQFGYGQQSQAGQRHARTEVFCSNCSKKYSTTSAFCPHCGDRYNPCPVCGADNSENATKCVSCGTVLGNNTFGVGTECSNCHAPIEPGTKFCPRCGHKL